MFKRDPFHPSFRSHEIRELSARAKHTIYSAVIESDLRVIFRIDGRWVTSLDVGTHKIYRQ
jgi:mRNA-degrading endonuclease YafQ of YafQ-DinJ toxin-antitoxin module